MHNGNSRPSYGVLRSACAIHSRERASLTKGASIGLQLRDSQVYKKVMSKVSTRTASTSYCSCWSTISLTILSCIFFGGSAIEGGRLSSGRSEAAAFREFWMRTALRERAS